MREFQKDVKIFEILKVFKKYIKFPKYSIWSELLSRIPEVLIVYFITQNFSTNLLGQYSISILIISLPNIIFINSIMESFSPRIAMAKHENNHLNLLLQVTSRVFSLSFFPILIFLFFGKSLMGLIFGEQWFIAGSIVEILIIKNFFEIIFTPSFSLINVLGMQKYNLLKRIANVILISIAFSIGGYMQSYEISFYLMAFFEGMLISFLGIFIMLKIQFPISAFLKFAKYYILAASILISFLLVIFDSIINIASQYLIIVICICSLFYYTIVLKKDNELRKLFFSIINLNSIKKHI